MREINEAEVGENLRSMLKEKHPLDEDIGILNDAGKVIGVVIPSEAYEFFLQKVEEEEDRQDRESLDEFRNSGEKD